MHQVGGAGEHGGMSVSFPQLTDADEDGSSGVYSSSTADVEPIGHTTGASNVSYYERGDGIYYSDDTLNSRPAQHLLVESDDASWSQGDDRTLTLRVTPEQEGEFRILIRGSICAIEYTNCSRRPESGIPAQQGWLAVPLNITVTAPTDTRTPEEKLAHLYAPILRMHPSERWN